jgi:hypothetical protein
MAQSGDRVVDSSIENDAFELLLTMAGQIGTFKRKFTSDLKVLSHQMIFVPPLDAFKNTSSG